MKRFYSSVLAIIIAGAGMVATAQSTRTVLVQHFTQASCGPCAGQNPILRSTIDANSGIVNVITHQVSWPGVDPMNAVYPAGPENMRNYYGVTGVPNSVLDGTSGPGAPNTIVTTSTLTSRAAVSSPFDISLSATLDISTGILSVTMDNTASASVSGTLKAHIAVTENTVSYAEAGSPGGTNGETMYFDVLRQYLPNTNGTTLASSFSIGQNQVVNETWDFTGGEVADQCDLSVVAFIQNNTTKEVLQSAKVPVALAGTAAVDAGASAISNMPNETCANSFGPEFTLKNWGTTTMTSATIEYEINGGAVDTYNWTGTLLQCESTLITLPAYTFTPGPTNTITIDVVSVNGGADGSMANNNVVDVLNAADQTDYNAEIEILTDNYGSETSWTLKNPSGGTVATGSGYANNTTYTIPVSLADIGCYEFIINDSYGDGICCSYGIGHYIIRDNLGTTMLSGGEFTSTESRNFTNNTATGISVNDIVSGVNIFPNPFSTTATMQFTLAESAVVSFSVVNVLGELVHTQGLGTLSEGANQIQFNGSDLESGIYFFNITIGDNTITKRISLTK